MPKKPKQRRASKATRPTAPTGSIGWLLTPEDTTIVAAIVLACFVVFLPSLGGRFILDDDTLITKNEIVKSSDGLYRIWLTFEHHDYWPLTNSVFWLEWRLFGEHPTGYHLVNLGLHIASSLLVWRIVQQLAIPCAWLAALLFAIHPVNVESVAWISQSKNTLSMLFFLLSVLWYLKSQSHQPDAPASDTPATRQDAASTGRWYWLSLGAFTLAMLSKGSVAVMPLLILVILWWQRGRVTWDDLTDLAPFLMVAVILTVVNIWFQTHGSDEAIRTASFIQRLLGAGAVVWFYLSKALLPLNLAFVYPQWNIDPSQLSWWLPLVGAIIATALLFLKRNTRFGRPLLAAWLFFCIALVPVMGFTDVGYMKFSLVADHYQYISILAIVTPLAAAWATWLNRLRGDARLLALLSAAGVCLALGFLALVQSRLYADPVSLYSHALEKNPNSYLLHAKLGNAWGEVGNKQNAIKSYTQTLKVKPDFAEGYYNLAVALADAGREEEAITHYQTAIELKPDYVDAHNNLGILLARAGRPEEAIAQFNEALKLNPELAAPHNNLGNVMKQAGKFPEAVEHYRAAVRRAPDEFDLHFNLAEALRRADQLPEAIEEYQESIRLAPEHLPAYVWLATTYAKAGRFVDAAIWQERAVQLARSSGRAAAARQIENVLRSYRAGQASQATTASPLPNTSP